jgi:hypothetical protein
VHARADLGVLVVHLGPFLGDRNYKTSIQLVTVLVAQMEPRSRLDMEIGTTAVTNGE